MQKGNKQNIKNYRSISLLPICGKIFEKLIHREIYTFFVDNKLILSNQSDFKPRDSSFNQLLPINHEIYEYLDNLMEVRSVLLDKLKAFDKIWYESLIFKLQQSGISRTY